MRRKCESHLLQKGLEHLLRRKVREAIGKSAKPKVTAASFVFGGGWVDAMVLLVMCKRQILKKLAT